jgi:hypothetical protein
MLRTREHRREQPLDEYASGPIIGHEDRGDPEYEAVLADSVGVALLVVLDTLTPAEAGSPSGCMAQGSRPESNVPAYQSNHL